MRSKCSLLSLLIAVCALPAAAQTLRTWSASGGGSWNNPANWTGGAIPNSAGEAARFTNSSAITVTLDHAAGFTVGGLSVVGQNVTFNPGTGGGLTLAGASAWITNSAQLTLNAPLTSAGFIKHGSGTLWLGADNEVTLAGADITIAAGQLRGYSGNSGTGREFGSDATVLTLRSNTQVRFFQVTSGPRAYPQTLRLAGTGIGGGNPGALNNDSSTSASAAHVNWSGAIELDHDASIAAQNNGSFTLNTISGPGRTLTLNLPAQTSTITGAVNLASLVKLGGGSALFASGGSLAATDLSVQGGTLAFGAGATLSGVTNFTLGGGATLDVGASSSSVVTLAEGSAFVCPGGLDTTVRGGVVAQAGSRFGPGSGSGSFSTVTLTNQLVANGGTLVFDLNTTAAGANDRVALRNLVLAAPSEVVFHFPSGSPELWAPYTLFSYSGLLIGQVTNLTATLPGGTNFATFSSATPGVITVTFSDSTGPLVLDLTNGVRTFSALANATVTLHDRCELRLLAASNPLPGSFVHLNSPDAFLVLPNMLPSAVVSSVLSRVRVNGTAALADGNVRVVQYAMGAVVFAHPANYQPLRVFSGPQFTGASLALSPWVQYRGASLGALNTNITSFRLKRGYLATFAQNENGSGRSECYVAQDGDLEVGLLPAALERNLRYVVVYPWRWTAKKGIAGNIESGLNVRWKYNWNISENSTRDLEYTPIRQTQWWPSLSQNWQTRGASQLLGFNEPDRPDQANMSVATALAAWPDLLASGLRLGAPAVSDGGRAGWLYPFMDQADAAGLRVDFVPVHYYWCFNPSDAAGAANQMYNFLKSTYDRVRRPLWVTEWNNGANWTGCGDPTFAQQQAAIAAMIEMLDNTPFVERYALYNWVEDVRRLKWDDGSLTAAGVTYRDQASPIGYVQAVPGNGRRSFAQFRFEGNTLDSSGCGGHGVAAGSPAYTNGVRGSALVFDGEHTHVALPSTVARDSSFTFAAWVRWDGGGNWQRLFDFGNSTTHFMFLTPRSGAGTLRFGIQNGGGQQMVETAALPSNQWRHVAVTLSGSLARLYVNGVAVASNTSMSIAPSSFSPRINRLGQSHFIADPLFRGLMDEVLITDYALTPAQIAALPGNNAPQFTNAMLTLGPAFLGQSFSATLAGSALDPGDTLTYSKLSGPAWLGVASNGTLTGTPGAADAGTNHFTVRAADAAGFNGFAVLAVVVLRPPPVLPAQPDVTRFEQTLLTVTNTALSGIAPLSYELLEPPAGAVITPTGVIFWLPSEEQGPGSYVLTTVVTDGQALPQRATNHFTVSVLESNLPPVLAPIANQTLSVGQWLALTNTATDPDWPPTALTFSLSAGPPGAVLTPDTGILTWRPPATAAGTSNWFEVRVADDGVPSLAATQGFSAGVNPLAPGVLAVESLSPTHCVLSLTGEPGPDYTLQTATNLAPPTSWASLLTTNLTTSPLLLRHELPPDGSPRRFYRVLIGP